MRNLQKLLLHHNRWVSACAVSGGSVATFFSTIKCLAVGSCRAFTTMLRLAVRGCVRLSRFSGAVPVYPSLTFPDPERPSDPPEENPTSMRCPVSGDCFFPLSLPYVGCSRSEPARVCLSACVPRFSYLWALSELPSLPPHPVCVCVCVLCFSLCDQPESTCHPVSACRVRLAGTCGVRVCASRCCSCYRLRLAGTASPTALAAC
jgi:hypothetical protein